ncbi:hypothetical protein D7Z54_00760 [Salibacterium salarium]|uniref:Uncharacterized protein n=1 Tax=Salibacterium salarium TaxID=284579 RepID=A0A428N9T1_9BACI|nr:hypothetical protein [Salibacterium salarium]RSL35138.1 hypothetical protein D7Z54_00760 [Salibacterium salarium]
MFGVVVPKVVKIVPKKRKSFPIKKEISHFSRIKKQGDDAMIKKQRNKPLKLRQLESLYQRLHASHPKQQQIEKGLSNYDAGYRGEQSIDYH